MLKTLLNIFTLTTLIAVVSCIDHSSQNTNEPSSSGFLDTEAEVMKIYAEEPERALAIINSAETSGKLSDFHANLMRATVYSRCYNGQRLDTARQICENLLLHKMAQENAYFQQDVLEMLLNIARLRGDYFGGLFWGTRMADLQQESGEFVEALRTKAELGYIHTHIGQQEEGLAMIDAALRQLESTKRFNELDTRIIALKRKINILTEMDRPAEIIPNAKEILTLLDAYEKQPSCYADGTFREPKSESERKNYIAFYRAQTHVFLAQAYAMQKDFGNAEHYLKLFNESYYAQTDIGQSHIGETLLLLGKYDQALASFEIKEKNMGSDTLSSEYAKILKGRATIAEAIGQPVTACQYLKRYDALNNKLYENLLNSEAQLYASRFMKKELEQTIVAEHTTALRSLIISILFGVFLLVALTFTYFSIRQRHILRRKNRVLAGQIAEAQSYKNKYLALQQQQALPDSDSKMEATETSDDSKETTVVSANLNKTTDEELFLFLDKAITRDRLFLLSDFGRQKLIDTFGLSKERIGAAFSKGSTHTSVASYVCELRLEYAFHLMAERPELSIAQISAASGFISSDTFGRNFKARYGMTPTEYRQSL